MTIFEILSLACSTGALGIALFILLRKKEAPQAVTNTLNSQSERLQELEETLKKPDSFIKTLERQDEKLQELEETLKTFQRPRTGVVPRWDPSSEDKSAYVLRVYNDTNDKIYNVELLVPSQYVEVCQVYMLNTTAEIGGSLEVHMFPIRQDFATTWATHDLEPIIFALSYTDTPNPMNRKTIELPFALEATSKHMQAAIKTAKEKVDAQKKTLELVK